jgi:glutathionylspermidine synthase
VEELLSSFIVALDAVIQDEETATAQVSPEEWDAIKPSKHARRSNLLDILNVSMSEIILVPDIHSETI